jgi:hypothetical protein
MESKKKAAKPKSRPSRMPKWFPLDEEMKELSALLEGEVSGWPGVSKKNMFGYQGLYRNGTIFAALPRSRAMKSPRALMVKFENASPTILNSLEKDPRVDTVSGMSSARWFFFELDEASAMKEALGWLGRAYDAAKK